MVAVKLPEHSHCAFCGDPVPFREEYCNEECRAGEESRKTAEKRRDLMFYVSAVVVIVALFVVKLMIA